ncbi:MAG: hypothetical protein QG622_685 [Actinomycetota bacterium]|nr:hypothetical protein [Actinomycetota bacterium]
MHGYEMISELAARTAGTWRPSPGSIYPILQTLREEGLVSVTEEEGKRSYSLTEAGRRSVTSSDAPSPWDEFEAPEDQGMDAVLEASTQLLGAVDQVILASTPEQKARVVELLSQTRGAVFAVLADGAPPRR